MSQITRKVGEPLTLENYFNALRESNPESMDRFCKWIDEYKERVGWNKMFGANKNTMQRQSSKYKFHEIPLAMQVGILMEYWDITLMTVMQHMPENAYDNVDATDEQVLKSSLSLEVWVVGITRCFHKNAKPMNIVQMAESAEAYKALMES